MAFIDGNIVRILMQDFLTFDNMEVLPKPHLNVIIGPNGTGKSTIMCGLALALSLKPAITGRGKDVAEYVKHGKETATVEVEIFRSQKNLSNLVVKRVITRANTSQFFLQGQKCNYKEVEANLKKLGIALDNLCQFLPQDRVVEFAKMNNVQLLENTEKTVGGVALYEQHERVRNSGGEVQQLRTRLQQIQQQYQAELTKNSSVEASVRNHELRNALEAKIVELQTRRLWFLYTQQRGTHLQKKQRKDHLILELNKLKERWQPEAEQIGNFEQAAEAVKNKIKVGERLVSNISLEWTGLEGRWVEQEEARQDAVRDHQAKEQRHRQQQQNLNDLQKQLSVIQAEIDAASEQEEQQDDAAIQRELNDITMQSQRLSTEMTGLQQQLLEKRNDSNTARMSLHQVTDQINRMQDTTRRRMHLLQQRHQDAFRAATWLQSNTDKFRKTVYPPICTQLNVKDPLYAQYIEDRIPRADLIAFVCCDKDDVNRLKQLMDERKWVVNIVHSNGENLNDFRLPRSEQEVRRYGFDQYLLSAVEGPPAVLYYLCKSYQLHLIPVAAKESVKVQAMPKDIARFYIGDSRYHHSKSRYTSDVTTNLSVVQQAMLLTVTVDTHRLDELNQQQIQLQQQIQDCETAAQGAEQKVQQLSAALEAKRKMKQQLTQQRNHRRTLMARLEQKEQQILRTEKDKVDLDAAKKVKEHKLQNASRACLTVVKGWGELSARQAASKHSLAALRSQYKTLSDTITELTSAVADMEQLVANKREEVAEASARVKESVRLGQETLTQLLKALGLKAANEITNEVRSQFNDGEQGLEETEQKLTETEAHRDCLVTADDQVVAEYNRRAKHIEDLRLQLEELKAEETRCTHDMSNQRAQWLASIAQLTTTINGSFSALMARMQCAGEVKLSKPENEDDLSKYGLSICVRFRGSERLRELTAQQQSGGERAVSTALYLLALQTMSSVPFRCTDEINQGMDAENERLMLTMLVEQMTERHASQYFLITPKLLPNIPYNERVNFMCVFNGPKISNQISILDSFKRKSKLNKNKISR